MAGTIDQLNFEVILTDDAFQQKVKDDIGLAEELNDKLTTALEIKKKVDTKTFDEIANSIKNIEKNTESLDKKHRNYNSGIKQTNTALGQTTDIMRTLTRLTGITFGVETVRRFVGALVSVTGEFEVQKMALTSMLQDADKADEIFNTLRQEALNSPYTFQDLTKYAKQLTAFNIDADQLVETEKRLADVAAGLGVDMGRIILAYGQVKAAGVLKGTELRQFTEAGVPLLQSLAEQIQETEGHAISLSEVFQRISKKEIPFEMVEEAFKRMTSEGGKFYNMQEVLVNTLQGKIGKLRDVWQQALYDIGTSQDSFLKGAVDAATWLVSHMEKIGSLIMPVVKGFGAYAAVLAIVAARQKFLELQRFIKYLTLTAQRTNVATAAMRGFATATKATAGVIGALVAVAFILVDVLKDVSSESQKFNKELDEIHKNARDTSSYDAEIGRLQDLRRIVNSANSSYEERRQALAEIKSIVPGYHAQLTEEGRLINNNKEALDAYIESMNREARMKGAKDELAQLYQKQREVQREISDVWKDVDNGTRVIGYGLFGQELTDDGSREKKRLGVLSKNLSEVKKRIEDVNKEVQAGGGFIIPNEPDPTWTPLGNEPGGDIQARIAALKEVQGYYETLKDVMSDADIKEFFDSKGIQTNGFNFWEQILELARELETVNPEAAARVFSEYNKFLVNQKAAEAKEAAQNAEEQAAALEKWLETIAKWEKDYGGGTGLKGKMRKIIADYNNEEKAITEDLKKARETAEKAGQNPDAIEELAKGRRDANLASYRDAVNGLSDDIFKLLTQGLDLTNWNDKSIAQISIIQDKLKNLTVPDWLLAMIDDDNLRQELIKAVEQLAKAASEQGGQAKAEKRIHDIRKAAGEFNSLMQSLSGFASASGNSNLAGLASFFGQIVNIGAQAAESFMKKDTLDGILTIVNGVVSAIFKAGTAMAQLNARISEIRAQSKRDSFTNMLSSDVDSIFGTNGMAKVRNSISVISKLRGELGAMRANMPTRIAYRRGFIDNLFGTTFGSGNLASFASELGMDLYDAFGNLNANTLRAILDTYDGIAEEQRAWITEAINGAEAYEEAIEQLRDVVSTVFGDIASSAADAIVDQWINAGNAALDYADILDDVARRYAKMAIESTILDNVLNEDRAKSLVAQFANGDAEGAMASIAEDMATIQGMAPIFEQILSAFDPYFNRAGAESASNSLREGINKELVEGNSSLIASYMNAMRADLSVVRGLQSIGWQDVRLIREYAPTYADYMARIEANTFDNAQAAQSILARLQSIITPSTNGGSAVRTTR